MKKILSVFLVVIILALTLTSCEKDCKHEYLNGVCKKCDLECVHSYTDGVCSVCTQECKHSFNDGICSICTLECEHSLKRGVCSICNDIKLSPDVLNKRAFEYTYFELTWAPGTTDDEKEAFRKKYNVETDEELFNRYYNILISNLPVDLVDWTVKSPDIIEYNFVTSENPIQAYTKTKTDKYRSTALFIVEEDSIRNKHKNNDILYYEGEYLYSLNNSVTFEGWNPGVNDRTQRLDKEIVLKFVYVEK